MPTEVQEACFEAGIKFGSLYHQFAGTPVSSESVDSLARAIEESIENQPHCTEVTVEPQMAELREAIDDGDAEYTEFTGRFAEVSLTVEYEGVTVDAHMEMDGDYPLMRLVSVERLD